MAWPKMAWPKVAWVCNWLDPSLPEDEARLLNFSDTTVAFLMRQDPAARVEKLIGLVRHNATALTNQVNLTAVLPPPRRAMRIATHLLPCYSHPAVRPIYDDPALRATIEEVTAPLGPRIKDAGIRISTHPGQYCVLATESDAVRQASIEEIEYHVHVMRLLGHSGGWHPHGAHVNVHGGGRAAGIEAFRASLALLSEDAQGLLTIENDEIAYGLDDVLPVADALPVVLDIHHHWVMTGDYIRPDDPRITRVIESWRGTRPVAHVSSPKEALVEGMDPDTLPDRAAMLEAGANTRDLRAHSNRLWNRAHAAWAAGHLAWADIEVEAKDKNLATQDFAVAAGLVEFVEPPPAYVKPVRARKAAAAPATPEPRRKGVRKPASAESTVLEPRRSALGAPVASADTVVMRKPRRTARAGRKAESGTSDR
ncbi:UV damage endonuclease UvsE [Roseomonas sp. CCTCC AB2023176]|uniref:UV damage endonuclease UvsE n=1 Tax=Roseomonas sp. CCTCC AB2023176 TaxID=3342640 RepID=UPI0035DA3C55